MVLVEATGTMLETGATCETTTTEVAEIVSSSWVDVDEIVGMVVSTLDVAGSVVAESVVAESTVAELTVVETKAEVALVRAAVDT